jgi:hypothetical protein
MYKKKGYPAPSPPGGLSSRAHAGLQLHCGRHGLLAIGFSSDSSALRICSVLVIQINLPAAVPMSSHRQRFLFFFTHPPLPWVITPI